MWVSLLDIGCETRSFLHYIRFCYQGVALTGMDVMKELLDKGQRRYPTIGRLD